MRYLPPALLGATALLALSCLPAWAAMENFTADLTGAAEVPPVETTATGKVEASLDTDSKVFTWTINYEGLSGEATAAHFHGPAAEGANAAPVVPIEGALASPISGNATLTDEQISQLQNGQWYFNIHTAAHPDGEIRGQVKPAAM
ncbi:CHRD domain-containing protein [Devosia sp. ZB163]|uniref:CHRD domain-containing protein n=1 Tax=Devosia sp. ZB163 TaxID=3025938 RepID=UPI00235E5A55|nr:CHRD domain-containing protein [Devosia sp. ZB163]MDC9825085.1 CHRD domain-containing protein [Devosia sp. ZB163]